MLSVSLLSVSIQTQTNLLKKKTENSFSNFCVGVWVDGHNLKLGQIILEGQNIRKYLFI